MTQAAPAFWVKYRGRKDPQLPSDTAYVYAATFWTMNSPIIQLYTATFTAYGPPQLTKNDYMEIRWSPMIGLGRVQITKNSAFLWQTNGAEQGFRDEGQFNVINGGVTNQ